MYIREIPTKASNGFGHYRISFDRQSMQLLHFFLRQSQPERVDTLAVVSHDGTVFWVPPARMSVNCNMKMTNGYPQNGAEVSCVMM